MVTFRSFTSNQILLLQARHETYSRCLLKSPSHCYDIRHVMVEQDLERNEAEYKTSELYVVWSNSSNDSRRSMQGYIRSCSRPKRKNLYTVSSVVFSISSTTSFSSAVPHRRVGNGKYTCNQPLGTKGWKAVLLLIGLACRAPSGTSPRDWLHPTALSGGVGTATPAPASHLAWDRGGHLQQLPDALSWGTGTGTERCDVYHQAWRKGET